MKRHPYLSRRMFLAGVLAAPTAAASAPLIDLSNGQGIFAASGNRQPSERFQSLYTGKLPVTTDPSTMAAPAKPTFLFDRGLRLNFRNTNVDEQMSFSVSPTLEVREADRRRLNHFLRDWRENEVIPIDDQVLNDLLLICAQQIAESNEIDVSIASGYRSNKTNQMLRQRSREVALNSLHTEGKAIDFWLPTVSSRRLGAVAREICNGGVGVYRNFVHIDSGPRRRWGV